MCYCLLCIGYSHLRLENCTLSALFLSLGSMKQMKHKMKSSLNYLHMAKRGNNGKHKGQQYSSIMQTGPKWLSGFVWPFFFCFFVQLLAAISLLWPYTSPFLFAHCVVIDCNKLRNWMRTHWGNIYVFHKWAKSKSRHTWPFGSWPISIQEFNHSDWILTLAQRCLLIRIWIRVTKYLSYQKITTMFVRRQTTHTNRIEFTEMQLSWNHFPRLLPEIT